MSSESESEAPSAAAPAHSLVPAAFGTSAAKGPARFATLVGTLCYVCDKPMSDPSDMTAKLGTLRTSHKRCYAGSAALQRLASSDLKMKEYLSKLKADDPDKFKFLCCSMATTEKRSRTPQQRNDAKRFLEEFIVETSVRRRRRITLMTQRQFVAYYVWQEMLSKDEAMAKWEQESVNPKVYRERNEAGEIVVAVRKPTELEHIEGHSKRRRLIDEKGIGEGEEADILADMQHADPVADQSFAKYSDAFRMDAAQGSTGLSPSQRSSLFDGALERHKLASGGLGLPPQPPLAQSNNPSEFSVKQRPTQADVDDDRSSTRSAASTVRRSIGGDAPHEGEARGSPAPQPQRGAASAATTDLVDDGGELVMPDNFAKFTVPEFLAFKQKLKSLLQIGLGDFGNDKKSPLVHIKDLIQKHPEVMEEAEVASLGFDDEIKKVEGALDTLKEAIAKVSSWRFALCRQGSAWTQAVQEVWSARPAFVEEASQFEQLAIVIRSCVHDMKKQSVLKKRSENYKKGKVVAALRGGGYPTAIAMSMSKAVMHNVACAKCKLDDDFAKPVVFEDGCKHEAAGLLWELVNKHMDDIVAEAARMEAKKKAAMCMKQVDMTAGDIGQVWEKMGIDFDGSAKMLSRPWLVVQDIHACALGSALRWPFLGMSCLVVPLGAPMVCCTTRLQKLVDNGQPIDSLKVSFEGEDAIMKEDDCSSFVLPTKSAAWVPFGVACLGSPFVTEERKIAQPTVAKCLVICCPDFRLAKGASEKLRREMSASWSRHFEANAGKPWNTLEPEFMEWMKTWMEKTEKTT